MSDRVRALTDEAALEAALGEPRVIIYKHSPICGTSAMALAEIHAYLSAGGEVPVYIVDVLRRRDLARAIAERLDVVHQSPQVILLERGQVAWKVSHWEIRADALAREIAATDPSGRSGAADG
jgi:bacillithiol system protein YtxJ